MRVALIRANPEQFTDDERAWAEAQAAPTAAKKDYEKPTVTDLGTKP